MPRISYIAGERPSPFPLPVGEGWGEGSVHCDIRYTKYDIHEQTMSGYSETLNRLIKALATLPGIGPKSAERIAIHLLKSGEAEVRELARLIIDAKEKTFFCEVCRNLSSELKCHICMDPTRDRTSICVVGDPKDVAAIEKTGVYRGLYHVLFGALSPIEGIGPQELRLDQLIKRILNEGIHEVILATNPNTEGETTALYLAECLKSEENVKVTRIARGVPVGSHIEYVDQATLQRALEGRTSLL